MSNKQIETALTNLLEKREVDFFPLYINSIMKEYKPRRLIKLTSMIQEGVLQSKEPEKGEWNNNSLHNLLNNLIIEVSELLDAIQKLKANVNNSTKAHVLLECADVQNFASMIQDRILDHPFNERGI